MRVNFNYETTIKLKLYCSFLLEIELYILSLLIE